MSMNSLAVKAFDPLTVDFEAPGHIKSSILKKLKRKKEELDKNNLDHFVMRSIDKSDLPILLKETKTVCSKLRSKLLKGFQQKILSAAKDGKSDEISKLEESISYLQEPSDSFLAEMAWKEHVLHCVTSVERNGHDTPRLTELLREIICAEPVRTALQAARLAVKRRRRQLEEREKKRKRAKEGKYDKEESHLELDQTNIPTQPSMKESRAQAAEKKEAVARTKALEKLSVGTVLMCAVQGVSEFGVFLETYFADARLKAMCHLSRVHKLGKVIHAEQLEQRYQFGDRVTAVVLEVDHTKGRVKVSFRDSDFALYTKMTHKHLRGDQRASHRTIEDTQKREVNRTLSSVRVSSLAEDGKNRKALFEEALAIVRKLNCRSTNEKHKGKRMSQAMRVKLTAEFLGLDVQREYNRFMFREKLRKLRNRGAAASLQGKTPQVGTVTDTDGEESINEGDSDGEGDADVMRLVAQAEAADDDEESTGEDAEARLSLGIGRSMDGESSGDESVEDDATTSDSESDQLVAAKRSRKC